MFDPTTLQDIQNEAGLTAMQLNLNMKPFQFIGSVLPYIYGAAGIFLLINIITAGFKIMNSQGDPKAMQEAQLKLKNSVVGMLILFASFWIVQVVLLFFGINITIFGS
jgi:hypothetical protein